ncbi:MAG: type II secretion system GspH family protein [Lachnospiraceae bacterium]|nr:type II secretion system GspH family protein [Lachnospiraceae bacterium]
MKNNKGYTLVELLVTLAVFAIIMAEVGSMMMNSSKLYRNGTYEVELQTEAQQIVQQMEELLIDVNHSVSTNYQVSLSSDFITISNNSNGTNDNGTGVYTIYNFTVDKDPERGYGNLYFNKTSNDGSSDVTNVLMGEYVQSISLDMAAYEYDVVTLNVSMNNGRYGYQASQDIYLRNGVGSGGNHNYANGGSYKEELNVLRYRTYSLADLYNTDEIQYTYEWDPADPASTIAATIYELHNPNNNRLATLETSGNFNKNDGEAGPFTLLAHGNDPAHTTIRIKISTDAIGCGKNDAAVIYQNTSSGYTTMAPAIVKGINIASDQITRLTVTAVYKTLGSTLAEVPLTVDLGNDRSGQNIEFKYGPSDANCVLLRVENVWFNTNEDDNTFEVYSGLFYNGWNNLSASEKGSYTLPYYYYIDTCDAPMYYDVHVEYQNGWQELDMKLYLLPTPSSAGVDPMPDGIAGKFWQAVGMD